MNSEFTIRSVPPEVDLALRIRAEREGKSLNAVVLEILADGLDLDGAAGE
jgi:plasmid stability protein